MKRKLIIYIAALCFVASISGCKDDFLEVKPDKSLVVPTRLKDLQAVLDNTEMMNINMNYLGEIGSDDYYLSSANVQSISVAASRNAYTWEKDIYEGNDDIWDWNNRYRQVFYANVALEGLEKITGKERESPQWKHAKGSALFYRAWAHYQLAQLFCKTYDKATASADPGIVIRKESDINVRSTRSTVQVTYDAILDDLKQAKELLLADVSVKTRPSKAAALAMLARMLLVMDSYDEALKYSLEALALKSTLIDLNTLNVNTAYPFNRFNSEVLFHAYMASPENFTVARLNVDSTLFKMYHSDDRRRQLFFSLNNGITGFKGSYEGSTKMFCGISTNEVFLIAAECYARRGDVPSAIQKLNELLVKRYTTGKFVQVQASDNAEALKLILDERRKELLFRGLRWTDLRRLNKEPEFQKTLTRVVNGTVYTLRPGDPKYVLPIPDLVVFMSGIPQNPR